MKLYHVWFQDGHILMQIQAKNNADARKEFNKCIKIKEINKVTKRSRHENN